MIMAKNRENKGIFDTSDLTNPVLENMKKSQETAAGATPPYAHTDTHTDTEELKTKRMYLLVRPSIAEKINAAAKAQKTSANDLIHRLMEQYIEENNL